MALSAAVCVDRVVRAASTKAQIDRAVAATYTWDYGQSRKALLTVENLIKETHGNAELRAHLERQLVRQLESNATFASKQFVCRKLWIIGTDASVPALAKVLLDADAKTAEMACYALCKHPSPAVGRALRDGLAKTQGTARVAVIKLLGERRDAQSAKAIAKLARSQKAAEANAAIAALGQLATDGAVEALAALRKSDNAERRAAATHASLQAAQELAARGKTAEANAIYEQLAAPGEPLHIRRGALLGGIALGGPEAPSLVLSALRGKDEALEAAAIASVRTMRGKNLTSRFAHELPKLPARQQVLLIGALVDRGDPAARPAITGAAAHSEASVRVAALKALGVLGDASSVPVLVGAAAGSNRAEAEAAATSLRILKGDGVDAAIVDSMKAAKSNLRAELIDVLADRRYADAVPALLSEAAGDGAKVCKAAFKALGRLAGPKDLPMLVKLLVELKAENARPDAERAIVLVARKIADQSRRADAVLAALNATKQIPARCSLLRVLGGIANDRAYEALVEATNAENAEVKNSAVRALANWPDARAVGQLLKILGTSSNDTHRILALRGYVWLLGQLKDRPAELVKRYARAMAHARRAAEKKLVLSGLANVQHADALKMATDCLQDEQVRPEAALAAMAIARRLLGSQAEAVDAAMKKIVATVPDADLHAQARGLIREPPPPLPDVYLDALTPIKAISGNEGGRGKPQINRNCVGRRLRLKGVTYKRGVGEHAKADLTYALKPEYRRFVCIVGLDDQVGRHGDVRGSIVVRVFIDDKLMVQTPVLRGAGASSNVNIEIPAGSRASRLVVDDAGDGVGYDDADFVNAGFIVDGSGKLPKPSPPGSRPLRTP